jgi:hypothetical protein
MLQNVRPFLCVPSQLPYRSAPLFAASEQNLCVKSNVCSPTTEQTLDAYKLKMHKGVQKTVMRDQQVKAAANMHPYSQKFLAFCYVVAWCVAYLYEHKKK